MSIYELKKQSEEYQKLNKLKQEIFSNCVRTEYLKAGNYEKGQIVIFCNEFNIISKIGHIFPDGTAQLTLMNIDGFVNYCTTDCDAIEQVNII